VETTQSTTKEDWRLWEAEICRTIGDAGDGLTELDDHINFMWLGAGEYTETQVEQTDSLGVVTSKRNVSGTGLLYDPSKETAPEGVMPFPEELQPYFIPSREVVDGHHFKYLFNWDTYFTIQGLWDTENEKYIKGMVENLMYLVEYLGHIPNSTGKHNISNTQPPFLSTLARQVIESEAIETDREWEERAYSAVKKEYEEVWHGTETPYHHLPKDGEGLSRYYSGHETHEASEIASGWDYTTRFENEAMHYLPVDLNSFLYKTEQDLAWMTQRLGGGQAEQNTCIWLKRAERRKETINRLSWNDQEGMFYDYNFVERRQSTIMSLGAYATMWAGLATREQADRLTESLSFFETDHGLTATPKDDAPAKGKQWAAPNGWAPLHDMAIDGMINYGKHEAAKRVTVKFLRTILSNFKRTGKVHENFNVVDEGERPPGSVYPNEGLDGFGWSNAWAARSIERLRSGEWSNRLNIGV